MMYLWLPLFEAILKGVLQSTEFTAWLSAVDGPGAVVTLERLKAHAVLEIERMGH
jgi:hypothetical protein